MKFNNHLVFKKTALQVAPQGGLIVSFGFLLLLIIHASLLTLKVTCITPKALYDIHPLL